MRSKVFLRDARSESLEPTVRSEVGKKIPAEQTVQGESCPHYISIHQMLAKPTILREQSPPSLGAGVIGPMHFQYRLCAIPTSQTVFKASSLGKSGGSGGSGSPNKTFATANAEFEMDSRL